MKIRTLHFIFLGLLLITILFELTFFLKFKPFYSFPDIDQEQYDFVTDMLLERKLMKMSLEEKVGALFIIGFNGTELDEETEKFIRSHYFTHFLLLGKNIQSEEQLTNLTAQLCQFRELTNDFTGKGGYVNTRSLQCLISTDQEGGRVSRIKFDSMDQTPQSEISNIEQAYKIAKGRGETLANLNINMNFAPVVEIIRDENSYLSVDQRAFRPEVDHPLDDIGDSSYAKASEDKHQRVFQLSQAMVQGYNDTGIVAVPKHFPGGLGRQDDDPHQSLPVLNITKQELDQDLIPFQKLIQSKKLKAIMTTHILYSQIDSENPVTTSEKFIRSILRGDLGFRGVVVTDDLIMKGISSKETVEQIAKKAFLAGHDLILISGPSQAQAQAHNSILKAVRSGEISQKYLHQSLKRILLVDKQ